MDAVAVGLAAIVLAGYPIVWMWIVADCRRMEQDRHERRRWLRIIVLAPFVGPLLYFVRRMLPERRRLSRPAPSQIVGGAAVPRTRQRVR